MLQHPQRGPVRGSMFRGRSVHNQSDLFDGVSYIYYHLFYHVEDNGVLEPSNPQHLFSLRYVYVPRINRHIEKWRQGFVCHRIRTAGNRSSMQLYILGLLNLRRSQHVAVHNVCEPTSQVNGVKFENKF